MKVRALLLVLLLAAGLGASFRPEVRGKMEEFNSFFLDFLNANARGEAAKQSLKPADEVLFIEFREADKNEFSSWPPAPLDYIMVLKRLAGHDPDVVAFTDVLKWDKADVQFTGELQQTFVRFPSVALAFGAESLSKDEPDSAIHEDLGIPSIGTVVGNAKLAPRLGKYEFPAKSVRTQMEPGFVLKEAKSDKAVPMVAWAGSILAPSLAAQVLALREHAPYATQRLRFGRGAGLYLGSEVFVPLNEDGTVTPLLNGEVDRVNALDLMTPPLQDEASKALEAKLNLHSVIIVGVTPSEGERQVRAIAWALALPKLHRAPVSAEWIAAALALLLALWQLRFTRFSALIFGLAVVAVMLALALTVFQMTRHWCAPALPGGITALATMFCFFWPHRKTPAPHPLAESSQGASS